MLERGNFTSTDTQRVAAVLRFYSLEIPFYIIAVLASRVVVALRASNFMLLTTVVNLTANILLNYLFIQFFGVKGIALSTAVVYFLSALMLYAYILAAVRKRQSESARLDDD